MLNVRNFLFKNCPSCNSSNISFIDSGIILNSFFEKSINCFILGSNETIELDKFYYYFKNFKIICNLEYSIIFYDKATWRNKSLNMSLYFIVLIYFNFFT